MLITNLLKNVDKNHFKHIITCWRQQAQKFTDQQALDFFDVQILATVNAVTNTN